MDKPTIYLTNFSSRVAGVRGSGRVFNIMAQPRTWEHGSGNVRALTPNHQMLVAVKAGRVSIESYRDDFVRGVRSFPPGSLVAFDGTMRHEVGDGDTLMCSCGRDKALAGQCHRAWAGELLRRSGWRVVLDGHELLGVDANWVPRVGEVES